MKLKSLVRSIISQIKIVFTNQMNKNVVNDCSYFTSYLIFYDFYFYFYEM